MGFNGNPPFSAPYAQGDGWFNGYTNPQLGSYQLASGLMHETGHNLGLKHGHVTQAGHGITFPAETANHDSLEYTVMTYRQFPGNPIQPLNNPDFPTTYMQDDIAALQYLYGAHYGGGADTYKWDPTTGQEFINGVGQGAPISNFVLMTVWDGGGNATYDFSNYTINQSIDLNPGQWVVLDTSAAHAQRADLGNNASVPGSPEYFARGNIAEAQIDPNNPNETTSLIKNVILGSGNDTVFGNHANNRIDGGSGTDTFVETGKSTDHSFTLLNTGYIQIQDLRPGTPDGTDLIKSIALVQFTDGTFNPVQLLPHPTITGTVANQAVTDHAIINAFALVKITDPNVGQTEAVTVTPSQTANGTLFDPNAATDGSTITNGIYKVTGTAAQVTADLDALIFHPTPYQVPPGNTVTTGFTIALTDSPLGLTATDNTTSVIATAVAPNYALLQQDAQNFLLAENAGGNTDPILAEAAVNGPLTALLTDLGDLVTHLMTSTNASVPASVLVNLTVPVTNILADALFQSPNLAADNTTLLGIANLIGHGYHVV